MRKGKSLMGLAVVGQEDGTQLGHVKDLIFDHDTSQLMALMLSDKDLFGLMDAIVVPWPQVRSLGNDVILAASGRSKVKLGDLHESELLRGVAKRETSLSGTQIMTPQGQSLGTLADAYIDESSGRVVGYEVSGGFVADTLHGKKFLPAPPGLQVGKDAAIAPPGAAEVLKSQ